MVKVGDEIYNCIFPEECNPGMIISQESELVFIVEFRNKFTGKLYEKTILDYNIHKNNSL